MGLAAALLLLLAGTVMAEPAPDDRFRPAIEAMLAEPLEATSPAGLRMAGYLLANRFERGVADIDGYVYLQKLLVQQALRAAEQRPETAADYRQAAVVLTYNLAANTWPGWGRGNVGPVDESHRRLGLAAARKNVALAAELGLPPERRKNGYWLQGAHLLASGDTAAAAAAFAQSRDFAAEAKDDAGRLMAQGWIHAAGILAGEDEQGALDAIVSKLRELGDDGAFYADQYAVALAALGSTED